MSKGNLLINDNDKVTSDFVPNAVIAAACHKLTTAELADTARTEQCIILLNRLKTIMNEHAADATLVHKAVDNVNFPVTTPDATDLTTAIELYKDLRDANNAHVLEVNPHVTFTGPGVDDFNYYCASGNYDGAGGDYVVEIDSVHTITFAGTGLNNLTVGGVSSVFRQYVVEIDGGDPTSPNTFKWSNDGGATWAETLVPIPGAGWNYNLPGEGGYAIYFATTTGHVTGDRWTFQSTDTYKWSNDGGGSWMATGVGIFQSAADIMENHLAVYFGSPRIHTVGERWAFTVSAVAALNYHLGYKSQGYAGSHIIAPAIGDPTDSATLAAAITYYGTEPREKFGLWNGFQDSYYGHEGNSVYMHTNASVHTMSGDPYGDYSIQTGGSVMAIPSVGQIYGGLINWSIINDGGVGGGLRGYNAYGATDKLIFRFNTSPNTSVILSYLTVKP